MKIETKIHLSKFPKHNREVLCYGVLEGTDEHHFYVATYYEISASMGTNWFLYTGEAWIADCRKIFKVSFWEKLPEVFNED